MSSFIPSHDEGAAIPAPAANSPGQISKKAPPVPWSAVVAIFKTTSYPKPAATIVSSPQLIAQNITLEQDTATVFTVWLAMGSKGVLRRNYYEGGYKMRDEPSDDVFQWYGVTVDGGRVTTLLWYD